MWRYEQSSGTIFHAADYIGMGYSGHGAGLNNPALEQVRDVGPIPKGIYDIGESEDVPHLGKNVMQLLPSAGTNDYGRTGFYWHGDDIHKPGEFCASDGCIVSSLAIRQLVSTSNDSQLEVF